MKVWDARKKACLQTYKGHGGEVDAVSFSPDGLARVGVETIQIRSGI